MMRNIKDVETGPPEVGKPTFSSPMLSERERWANIKGFPAADRERATNDFVMELIQKVEDYRALEEARKEIVKKELFK